MTLTVQVRALGGQHHAFVKIPEWVGLPELVVWNRNVYVLTKGLVPPTGCNGPVYVQAFAWWATTEGG